ncbi:MAG: hypothetical protein R2748_17725 [Bryobacterales bacterium]
MKRQANARVNTVPTVAMRSGDFSGVRDIFDPMTTVADPTTARHRNDLPESPDSAHALRLGDQPPHPGLSAARLAGLVNNQLTTPKDKQQWNQGDIRIDHNLNEKNAIFTASRSRTPPRLVRRPSYLPRSPA